MPIAPRFTPSIGNVGSMPTPKAQADMSTAAAFDTLAKVVGNAADVAEKVAKKQEAHSLAKTADNISLYRATRERALQEHIDSTKGDPRKIAEFKYDNGVSQFIADNNIEGEDAVHFKEAVRDEAYRDETRFKDYARKSADTYAVSALDTSAKENATRLGEAYATNDEYGVDYYRRSISHAVNAIGEIRGIPPETTSRLVEHTDAAAKLDALKHLSTIGSGKGSDDAVVSFYEKHKGSFGELETAALAYADDAYAGQKARDLLDKNSFHDPKTMNLDVDALMDAKKNVEADPNVSPKVIQRFSTEVDQKVRQEIAARNAYGKNVRDAIDGIVLNSDSTKARVQLDAFLKTVNWGRIPDEDRAGIEALGKNPAHSNPKDLIELTSLMSQAEAGEPAALDAIQDAEKVFGGRTLSVEKRAEMIARRDKILGSQDAEARKEARKALDDCGYKFLTNDSRKVEVAGWPSEKMAKESALEAQMIQDVVSQARAEKSKDIRSVAERMLKSGQLIKKSWTGSVTSSTQPMWEERRSWDKTYGKETVDQIERSITAAMSPLEKHALVRGILESRARAESMSTRNPVLDIYKTSSVNAAGSIVDTLSPIVSPVVEVMDRMDNWDRKVR